MKFCEHTSHVKLIILLSFRTQMHDNLIAKQVLEAHAQICPPNTRN